MIVIGITGSIGMGKSHIARTLRLKNIPVFDADIEAGKLLNKPKIIARISKSIPGIVVNQMIDKQQLAGVVFKDLDKLKLLEAIIHPELEKLVARFLRKEQLNKRRVVALEIPLLFESNFNKYCDIVLLASSPKFLQKKRVMRRKNMTLQRFEFIKSRQMPEKIKKKLSDVIIHTGIGKAKTYKIIEEILRKLNARDYFRY